MAQVAEFKKPAPPEQALPRLIDLAQLAEIWALPKTWLQHWTRSACKDPLPCVRFGKYVRVDCSDPKLADWLNRRRTSGVAG